MSDMSNGEENIDIKKDIIYTHKFGMDLTLDLLQPKYNNRAAVLFFNSGGFYSPIFVRQDEKSAGSRWMLFQETQGDKIVDLGLEFSYSQLLSNGFTVFDIRHGSGSRFTLDEIVEDCRIAVQFIKENAKEFDIDPDRIGVWGMSAGGYLAAFVGANLRSHIKAVVSYFPTGYNWDVEEEEQNHDRTRYRDGGKRAYREERRAFGSRNQGCHPEPVPLRRLSAAGSRD